jgi:signal transduction histidine kinase
MSAGNDVIVLWTPTEGPDACAWMTHAPPGVRVVRVGAESLATAIPAALARGPVIAVVAGDHQAHRALALGVDEVVRAGETSIDNLSAAVQRARLRAIGRDLRDMQPEGETGGIELLAATVTYRLASPLAVASVNLGVLEPAVAAIARLADAYAGSAAAGAESLPDSEMKRVVALRASAPATPDLHATVHDLASALREASSAVAYVHALVATPQGEEAADLTSTIFQFGQLVGPVVERVADLRIELPRSGTRIALGRSTLVQALASLVANALHSMRERTGRGTITLRAEPRVSAALVEIIDNGGGMSARALADASDPSASRQPGGSRLGLAKLTERLRREGAELVLESEPGIGTTARLFVPLVLGASPGDPNSN